MGFGPFTGGSPKLESYAGLPRDESVTVTKCPLQPALILLGQTVVDLRRSVSQASQSASPSAPLLATKAVITVRLGILQSTVAVALYGHTRDTNS